MTPAQRKATRTRIAFDVDTTTAEAAKTLAVQRGMKLAHLASEALQDHLSTWEAETLKASVAPAGDKRETKAQRQARFLDALEQVVGPNKACKLTEIPRKEVREWMTDKGFEERYLDAKEAFVETQEEALLDLSQGRLKGQVVGQITFMNSNDARYGRVKVETVNRFMAVFISDCYERIRVKLGDETGDAVVKDIRELADLRLSLLTPL